VSVVAYDSLQSYDIPRCSTTLYNAAPVRERNVIRQLTDRSTLHWRGLVTWRGLISQNGRYVTPFCAFSLALGQEDAFAPILSRVGDEPDKASDPGQHQTVHHSAAIADSAIATSTKVSEKVGARPRSAKADGLRALTVAPVRLRLCQ
jgi:hypothetical protein